MCNATLLAVGSLTATVAGGLTSASGAYNEAKANRQSLEYQAAVDRNNAQLMDWEAQDATARGEKSVQKHQLDTAALKGTQRATIASRGIDLSEGTPARILTDTDFLGALDNETIRSNAGREAWGYRAQGQNYNDRARSAGYGARSIRPGLAGATALLDGVSTVASKWYTMKAAGALGG